MASRALHATALSFFAAVSICPTLANALSCERSAPRPNIFAWPYGELPTQPLLRVTGSGHFAETVQSIGGAVRAHLLAEDHAIAVEVVETRRIPERSWSLEEAWADVRPVRPLAPRTAYILHLVLPGGRVHVVGRDTPQVWTTADGPDVTPPRVVRAPAPIADHYDPTAAAFIAFAMPTLDDSAQVLELAVRELPGERVGRRAVDPTPRTIRLSGVHASHLWLGQKLCSENMDVIGADRRFSMHITAIDAAGNRTRVPGVVFEGIDPAAERSRSGRRAR